MCAAGPPRPTTAPPTSSSAFVRHLVPAAAANGPDDAEAVEAVAVADDVELARRGLSVHFVLAFPPAAHPQD